MAGVFEAPHGPPIADAQSWPLTPLVGALVGFVAGGYWAFTKSALKALHQDIEDEKAAEAAAADAKTPARKRKNKTK